MQSWADTQPRTVLLFSSGIAGWCCVMRGTSYSSWWHVAVEWWRCVCAHSRGGRQGTLLPQSFMLRRLELDALPSGAATRRGPVCSHSRQLHGPCVLALIGAGLLNGPPLTLGCSLRAAQHGVVQPRDFGRLCQRHPGVAGGRRPGRPATAGRGAACRGFEAGGWVAQQLTLHSHAALRRAVRHVLRYAALRTVNGGRLPCALPCVTSTPDPTHVSMCRRSGALPSRRCSPAHGCSLARSRQLPGRLARMRGAPLALLVPRPLRAPLAMQPSQLTPDG